MFPFPEHQKFFNEQYELNTLLSPINPYNLIPLPPSTFTFDKLNDLHDIPSTTTTTAQAQRDQENSLGHRCSTSLRPPLLNNTEYKGKSSGSHKVPARKDRHSKINTAAGPRDRRMRLSLDVARKFFNLQDMLGFDKPSKTVLWLLTESKVAIKELTEVSTQKLRANGVQWPMHESSNSDGEVISTVSHPKCKARLELTHVDELIKSRSKKKATKPSTEITLESMLRREKRAQARARARERTSKKKMKSVLTYSSSNLPSRIDSNVESGLQYLETLNSREFFSETAEMVRDSSLHCKRLMKESSDLELSMGNFGINQMFDVCQNVGGIEIEAVPFFSEQLEFDQAFSEDLHLLYKPMNTPRWSVP